MNACVGRSIVLKECGVLGIPREQVELFFTMQVFIINKLIICAYT